MILLSFCGFPWWLTWLLPFLLGLLLGWILWGRLRARIADLEAELDASKRKNKKLQDDLDACRRKGSELDGQIALLNGRIREMKANASKKTTASNSFVAPAPVAKPAAPAPAPKQAIKSDKFAALKTDNLQVVEGIGPKMESVLKDNSVGNWTALASNNKGSLNDILGKYGDKYRIIDPTTWGDQAALARDGKWDELIALQKNLDTGKATAKGPTDSKVEKIMIKLGILKRWKQDDLKAVEGIGPKIAGLLEAAGINTWRGLANTSVDKIKSVLAAAGDRYRLADPTTWPAQAKMAADGDFDALQVYQDELDGGVAK